MTVTESEPQKAEAVVVAQPELMLPDGQQFFTDPSMFPLDKKGEPVPNFSVMETAQCFFGCGPDWLRWRMRGDTKRIKQPDGSYVTVTGDYPHGWFILNGELMEFRRKKSGSRYFTLSDIERMAHALAQNNVIDGAWLANVITIVRANAKMRGFIS